MFEEMTDAIREDTVKALLTVQKRENAIQRRQVAVATNESHGEGDKSIKKKPVRTASQKVGRNDPCPCGSGKKYKKCCGAGTDSSEN